MLFWIISSINPLKMFVLLICNNQNCRSTSDGDSLRWDNKKNYYNSLGSISSISTI